MDTRDELSNEPRSVPPGVRLLAVLLGAVVVCVVLWQSRDTHDRAVRAPQQDLESPARPAGQPLAAHTQRRPTIKVFLAGVSYAVAASDRRRQVLLVFDVFNRTERDVRATLRYPAIPGLRGREAVVVRAPEGLTPRRAVTSHELYFPTQTDGTLTLRYSVTSCHPDRAQPTALSAELLYRSDGAPVSVRVALPVENGPAWAAMVLATACSDG